MGRPQNCTCDQVGSVCSSCLVNGYTTTPEQEAKKEMTVEYRVGELSSEVLILVGIAAGFSFTVGNVIDSLIGGVLMVTFLNTIMVFYWMYSYIRPKVNEEMLK